MGYVVNSFVEALTSNNIDAINSAKKLLSQSSHSFKLEVIEALADNIRKLVKRQKSGVKPRVMAGPLGQRGFRVFAAERRYQEHVKSYDAQRAAGISLQQFLERSLVLANAVGEAKRGGMAKK